MEGTSSFIQGQLRKTSDMTSPIPLSRPWLFSGCRSLTTWLWNAKSHLQYSDLRETDSMGNRQKPHPAKSFSGDVENLVVHLEQTLAKALGEVRWPLLAACVRAMVSKLCDKAPRGPKGCCTIEGDTEISSFAGETPTGSR